MRAVNWPFSASAFWGVVTNPEAMPQAGGDYAAPLALKRPCAVFLAYRLRKPNTRLRLTFDEFPAVGKAPIPSRRPLRNYPWPDCARRVLCSRTPHRAIFTKSDGTAFLQSFQNRHEFHRNRHNYLESGGDRLFYRYGD